MNSRKAQLVISVVFIICVYCLHRYLRFIGALQTDEGVSKSKSHLQQDDPTRGGTSMATTNSCTTRKTAPKRIQTKPIWVASFPGSGAELFRELITGITGQPTLDGTAEGVCRNGLAVTCKTHWPTLHEPGYQQDPLVQTRRQRFHSTAILLIRNPSKAIPSWYNQFWESRVSGSFHARQAPEESWNKFRRRYHDIEQRIDQWKEMILYWVRSSSIPILQPTNFTSTSSGLSKWWIPSSSTTTLPLPAIKFP